MNAKSRFSIVLFGSPGSGKGTQAELIAKKYNLEHISTGDLFRNELANETELGLKAKSIMEQGHLCPDDITLNMLYQHIQKLEPDKGVILDGVPRTIQQAEMMQGVNFEHVIPVSIVIYLNVGREVVIQRMLKRAELQNRADDTPETIEKRLENYEISTAPLKSYYAKKGILFEVQGMHSIDNTFKQICEIIDLQLKK